MLYLKYRVEGDTLKKYKKLEKNHKKHKRIQKGFTMVELLVAISILGLLIIMAFPIIRTIQSNNTKKKYEEYSKTIISASKLYVDSYSEDIFNSNQTNQQYKLSVSELVKKDLIKDINISDTTCLGGKSNVWIVKYNDDYTYCIHLACKLKNSDDSIQPIYETKDVTGSCKQIANKIKIITYEYDDGTRINKYLDQVIVGDTNYRLISKGRSGFRFSDNGDIFLKWVDSKDNKEYTENTIYDKTITGKEVFIAKTNK